ncbi:MAG: putative S-layer protein [archaeon]
MKFKLVLFAIVFALFIATVSAANATIVSTSVPASAVHNQGSFPVSFNVSYTGVLTQTNVTLSYATTSGTVSSSSFTSSSFALNQNASSVQTLTVNYPSYQPGPIAGTISANVTGEPSLFTLAFSVPINSTPGMVLTSSGTLTPSQNATINVSNTGNTNLTNIVLSGSASFSPSTISSIAAGSSATVTVYSPTSLSSTFGTSSMTVSASSSSGLTNSTSVSTLTSFCSSGNVGRNLSISSIDIRNSGKDDTTWRSLDTITVKVDVDNNGAAKISSVIVELALLDSSGRNKIGDMAFVNSDEHKINLGSIGDGNSETATFEFKVPADFNDGSYRLAAKVYSNSIGQSKECSDSSSDNYQSIDVERESDKGKFITFDNLVLDPSPAACGDNVVFNFKVYNIGDEDQDRVSVRVINKELGVDSSYELTSGLNIGDVASVSTSFAIPQTAKNKTYTLALTADYDYKDGTYRQGLDTEKDVLLKVIGCTPSSSISTDGTDTTVGSGNDVTATITIRNTGSSEATYAIDAKDYASWGSLVSISNRVVTLQAGESKQITFTFNANSGVTGRQTFTVQTQSNGVLESKQVAATVSGSFLDMFKGNSLLWIVGIVNVILIILIIVVIVRIASR